MEWHIFVDLRGKLEGYPPTQVSCAAAHILQACRHGVPASADREYKSREVAESPIYVIVHSLLDVSFCTQPFPTLSGGLW